MVHCLQLLKASFFSPTTFPIAQPDAGEQKDQAPDQRDHCGHLVQGKAMQPAPRNKGCKNTINKKDA
jgi:hypothetical protein